MKSRISVGRWVIAAAVVLLIASTDSLGDPPSNPDNSAKTSEPPKTLLTVAEARGQAKLLHTTYESTLIAVHRAYFEGDKRQVVPAQVLEDVFNWVDEETKGKTRWISVNTEAMNIDHEPDSEFEKKAAKALASGEAEFELIDDGFYHRAAAITLVASCLRCHEPGLLQSRQRRRFAGLVISIPVKHDKIPVKSDLGLITDDGDKDDLKGEKGDDHLIGGAGDKLKR